MYFTVTAMQSQSQPRTRQFIAQDMTTGAYVEFSATSVFGRPAGIPATHTRLIAKDDAIYFGYIDG